MKYFWDTTQTVPDGLGFGVFDRTHVLWLGLFAVLTAVCCLHYRSLGEKGRGSWRKIVAVLLVADELFKQVFLVIGSRWEPSYLPLHLCSINIFLAAWHAFRPGRLTGNFLYTVCIPGAMAALLFPSWTSLPVANFMHIHSFTVHMLLAMYPIVLTVAGDIRPDVKFVPKCIGILLVMAAFAWFINPVLDANFFFMAEAGEGNPLFWFERNWGNHLLGFPVLVTAVVAVMHGPWIIAHKMKPT